MAKTDIVKIRKRLVGFKRVPTLIEIGNYTNPVQTSWDDYYSGTIYIPLRRGKFLAYDYTC